MRLFTYTIPIDDGAAPNPWGGYCTLNICKPKIRSVASVGDWVMATGSKTVPGHGDLAGKCVYLMKVTEVLPMHKYDLWARANAPVKIANIFDRDEPLRRIGDAIYDFSVEPPEIRPSVHGEANRKTDLGGQKTLVSNHFIYFGDRPIQIPERLLGVVHQGQGHKSSANERYHDVFLDWAESLFNTYKANSIVGMPQMDLMRLSRDELECMCFSSCKTRMQDNEDDCEVKKAS